MRSLEGAQLGSYELKECIGKGGFGAVYRAVHQKLLTDHALKLLHPHIDQEPDFRKRFEREAQLMAQLRHPHMMRVTDFCTDEELGCYFVMDLLKGEPLSARLQRRRLSLEQVRMIFGQLCDALGYIHQQGVYHRDIKPGNIFMAREGGRDVVKLLDFGVAAWRSAGSLTQSNAAVGTMLYIAPEQLEDAKAVDGRADLYSLAILFHECLTGATPFASESIATLIKHHLLTTPPTLQESAPDREWSPALDRFLQKALEKEPSQRFENARGFWSACLAALEAQAALDASSGVRGGSFARSPNPDNPDNLDNLDAGEAETRSFSSLELPLTRSLPGAAVTLPLQDAVVPELQEEQDSIESFSHKGLTGERVSIAPTPERASASLASKAMVSLCGVSIFFLVAWVVWSGWPQERPQSREAALRVAPAPKVASLVLTSDPPGAAVWRGTRQIAKTPCFLRGTPGETGRFVLKHKGFQAALLVWTFAEGRQEKRLRLKAISRSSIRVTSQPVGAVLWRGETRLGVTPHTLFGLPGRSLALTLTAPGHQKVLTRVQFSSVARRVLRISLPRLFVWTLRTQPAGASVKCGSKRYGRTPLKIKRSLAEGALRCTIAKAGFLQERVRWRPRSNRVLTLQLRQPF